MSNMPPRMLTAPLRLTAMTLRGLGPYLYGARLEIRPMTIICGENGSGKSTWLEGMRYLKLAAEDELFPLKVQADADRLRLGLNEVLLQPSVQNVSELKSARLQLLGELNAFGEPDESLRKEHRDKLGGPPGSIGLVLEAIDAVSLASSVSEFQELSDALASCKVIEVRWALPKLNLVQTYGDGFHQWIEIILDGTHRLRLQRALGSNRNPPSNSSSIEEMFENLQFEKHFTFEGSESLFGVTTTNKDDEIKIGYTDLSGTLVSVARESEVKDPEIIQKACSAFLKLFRQIVRDATQGVFPIGAVRKLLTAPTTTATPFDDRILPDDPEYDRERFEVAQTELDREFAEKRPDLRYVGHDGGNTQELHAYWAYNLMRQPVSPYCGEISKDFVQSDFPSHIFSPSELLSNLPESFQTHVLSLVDPNLKAAWLQDGDNSHKDLSAIQVLNSAIQRRDLFRREFRPQVADEGRAMIGSDSETQDERLSSRKLLSDDEVKRVNRLLLEATFDKHEDDFYRASPGYSSGVYASRGPTPWHRTGYLFETFVSFWMKHLCQTQIQYLSFKGGPLGDLWAIRSIANGGHPPNGGLVEMARGWQPRGIEADKTTARDEAEPDLVETIFPPTTRFSADWSIMSTGFHQLAPIVVQSGLMRQHEIMSVENPEVHLHPSLQIKIAEFLIHQSNAGKVMLIETHSDLVVRRVLRAIRQEDIKQEAVRINFTHLEDGPPGLNFKHAQIEELQINDQGQIANWPDGFMDEDLKESQNWIETMQGDAGELDDE